MCVCVCVCVCVPCAATQHAQMLKDLDLAAGEKIQLAPGCKKRLLAELSADADFLASLGVMDYSLLVSPRRSVSFFLFVFFHRH